MNKQEEAPPLIAWGAAFVAGAALAVQSRFNGALGASLDEPILGAVWSFGSGLVLLLAAGSVPGFRRALSRLVTALRERRLRWWECIGGLFGGLFVATQTSVVGTLGVALFTVATVGGQTIAGMGVDHFGIGPKGRTPVTLPRLIAAVVAIAGVVITATSHSGGGAGGGTALVLALLTFFFGGLGQVQQGLNGRVAAGTGSAYAATVQNFLVGLVVLLVIVAVRLVGGVTRTGFSAHAPWWAWLGAPLGIAFIGLSAWATRHLGVLLLGLTALVGQLVTALILDLLDPAARREVGPAMILGMVITAVAAVSAARFAGRRASA